MGAHPEDPSAKGQKQEALTGTGSKTPASSRAKTQRYAACPWGTRRRQKRKPPSNPPGWSEGKSTAYDIAQRPNRVVVINGEQVSSGGSSLEDCDAQGAASQQQVVYAGDWLGVHGEIIRRTRSATFAG